MKDSVTKFDLSNAFKSLDEIGYPMPEKGRTSRNQVNLKETFKNANDKKLKTELLIEEYYDVNDTNDLEQADEEREDEIAKAKLARIEKIVDLDANSADDLLGSYAGKIIIQCPQCMTLFYKDEADIEKDAEDPNTCNVNEVCQHCGNASGYTIIGKVEAVSPEEMSNYTDEEASEEADDNALNLDFDETAEDTEDTTAPEEEGTEGEGEEGDLDLDLNLEGDEEEDEKKKEESLHKSEAAPSDNASDIKSENKTLIENAENDSLNEDKRDDDDYYGRDIDDALIQLKKSGHAEFWCRQGDAKAKEVAKLAKEKYGFNVDYTIDDEYCSARVVKESVNKAEADENTVPENASENKSINEGAEEKESENTSINWNLDDQSGKAEQAWDGVSPIDAPLNCKGKDCDESVNTAKAAPSDYATENPADEHTLNEDALTELFDTAKTLDNYFAPKGGYVIKLYQGKTANKLSDSGKNVDTASDGKTPLKSLDSAKQAVTQIVRGSEKFEDALGEDTLNNINNYTVVICGKKNGFASDASKVTQLAAWYQGKPVADNIKAAVKQIKSVNKADAAAEKSLKKLNGEDKSSNEVKLNSNDQDEPVSGTTPSVEDIIKKYNISAEDAALLKKANESLTEAVALNITIDEIPSDDNIAVVNVNDSPVADVPAEPCVGPECDVPAAEFNAEPVVDVTPVEATDVEVAPVEATPAVATEPFSPELPEENPVATDATDDVFAKVPEVTTDAPIENPEITAPEADNSDIDDVDTDKEDAKAEDDKKDNKKDDDKKDKEDDKDKDDKKDGDKEDKKVDESLNESTSDISAILNSFAASLNDTSVDLGSDTNESIEECNGVKSPVASYVEAINKAGELEEDIASETAKAVAAIEKVEDELAAEAGKAEAPKDESLEEGKYDVSDAEFEKMLNSKTFKDFSEGVDFENVEEVDEDSINECFTNYLTEVYKNVDNFKTSSFTITENNKMVIEGVINFKQKTPDKPANSRVTTFSFDLNNTNIVEGYNNEVFDNGSIKLGFNIKDNKMVVESLSYSYNIDKNLVEGLVKNK